MKPHVRIVFREPIDREFPLPNWQAVIRDRSLVRENITPSVDAILQRYQVPFIATREFSSTSHDWQPAEVNAHMDRIYRLILRDTTDIPEQMIADIELLPEVVSATPIQLVRTPLYARADDQQSLAASLSRQTDMASRHLIRLPDAHRFTKGDSSIIVAVLDTGVNLNHPELQHALLPGFDFVDIIDGANSFVGDYFGIDDDPEDDVGHGSHVAGIIAARGIHMPQGVVPKCKILPIRVLAAMKQGNGDVVGAGLIENIDNGIKWAVDQGAQIINMSLGVLHEHGGLPHQEVVEYAKQKGVTIVAASGNDGLEQRYYPSAFPNVIAVGATSSQREVSAFSSYGNHVSLVAPGENIYSAHVGQQYRFLSGTSHAAPFVAGAVAMLQSYAKSLGTTLSDAQVKAVLKHSCDRIDHRYKHPRAGYGMLNLHDALVYLQHKLQHRGRHARSNSHTHHSAIEVLQDRKQKAALTLTKKTIHSKDSQLTRHQPLV